jgi:hypothetical protein
VQKRMRIRDQIVRGKGFGGTGGSGKKTGGAIPRHAWGSGVLLPYYWIFLFLLYCSLYFFGVSFFKNNFKGQEGGTTGGEPRHMLVTSRGARGKFGVGGKLQREGWAWVFFVFPFFYCFSFLCLTFLFHYMPNTQERKEKRCHSECTALVRVATRD